MNTFATVLLMASSAAAFRGSIPVESAAGNKLMSKATRQLDNNEQGFEWVSGYSIKYTGCSSLIQVAGREGDGGGEGESKLYTQQLVKFSLCPEDYCSYGLNTECPNGARYVVDMATFVEVYTQFQMDAQEWACENLRENYCDCENANDDEVCENQCFMDNEMEYCIEEEDQEEFEVERYLECAEMEENNNNNNNNNNNWNGQNGGWGMLYVGPYCSAEQEILLGTFYDEGCQNMAPEGTYESANYGNSLPYSSESMVKPDCISCKEVDRDNENNNNNNNGNNNNGDDQQDEDNVIEMCEMVYEESGKCETDLPDDLVYYKDENACNFLDSVLPRLEVASADIKYSRKSGGGAARIWAGVFFLTTLGLLGYAVFLTHQQKSRKVDLSSKDAVEEQRREFS